MRVHISEKNSKLGRIPNISLPPIETCVHFPPCATLCYARKAYEHYARNTVKPAWDENLAYYRSDSGSYFADIMCWLEQHKPRYFRWHVGGDIPDEHYLMGMMVTALLNPQVQFLAYSRRPWAWGRLPENLVVLRSYWLDEQPGAEAGFKVVPKGGSIADEVACLGKCQGCYACWHLQQGEYRVIHLH